MGSAAKTAVVYVDYMKQGETIGMELAYIREETAAALPDLMRNAKLVESYNDKKNVFQIKKMHRFQAALCIDDKAYSVKMTVKEYKDGELALDTNTPLRLYHHRLEKEMPTGNSYKTPIGVTHKPSAGTPEYTLRQLLEDVKDSEGNVFFVADNTLRQQKQTSFVKGKYQTPGEAFISGSEAMNKVITQQTDVLDAMFRPDVGSISFYWGTPGIGPKFKKGSGVAHLIAHRNAQGLDGEGIARKMPEVLAYGQISGRQNAKGGDRVFISYDNHTAVLSLYRFGNRETWLVTGWLDNNSPDAQVKVNDSTSATNIEPTRFQSGDGAGDGRISIQPLGSDGKPLFHSAENDSPRGSITPVPEHAVPEFAGMKDFAAWLKDMLAEGGDIEIASTGQTARFTRTNVGASVKRSRSSEHRNAYAGLREMVRNAEYDHYEAPDARHPNGGGQDVYYSALRMGDRLYSVKLKLDVPLEYEKVQRKKINIGERIEDVRYKDHKLVEIEIAPALYRGLPGNQWPTQPANAISKVSLGVLRGSVKPSRIDGQTLFQPAAPGSIPTDSPSLVERLKEMERPDRQRMPARQAVFRTEEKNAVGVPLSRVTRIEGTVTREELDAALSALAGQDLPNLIEGVTAQVNSNQKRKLESGKAYQKSIDNGFSPDEHSGVAAQIANAWKWAAEARRSGDEKNNMPNVGIRRYVSALELNGRDAFAWLTVKETPTGLRIYSVELMDEKKLRGILGNGIAEAITTAPSSRSFEETISRLNILVNEQRQTLF